VLYTQEALGTQTPGLQNTVMVYTKDNTLNISSGTTEMNAVTLYDLQGRRLYTQCCIASTEVAINNPGIAHHQVLIVEIDTVNGKVSRKIVY
jgi:hypothetical protein